MRRLVVISGRLCTGKSGLAKALATEFGFHLIESEEVLRIGDEGHNTSVVGSGNPSSAGKQGTESLDRRLLDEIARQHGRFPGQAPFVVDGVGTRQLLDDLRRDHRFEVVHVHLYAPIGILRERFQSSRGLAAASDAQVYEECDVLRNEDVEFLKRDADVRIDTGRRDTRDTLVRVAARLGLYSPPDVRCVDVLIGGQYGSEGKGHIVAYLAKDYDVLVRVGGPNAGHTVSSTSGLYTYHQLPSGTRDTTALVLLGPGMTLNVESLLAEIADCKIGPERLFIDPQAMIIEKEDLEREREMVARIGSTGRGGGAAASRRIMGRRPGAIRLARDIPELSAYVGVGPSFRGSTTRQLEIAYRAGYSILVEGTQGSGLSLYHGTHPYVTARDTNVAGCLAEAGISPARVRRILMVVRPTPIRVGNPAGGTDSSGPLKHETTFKAVSEFAGLEAEAVERAEVTSTTKRNRRVGWFEWEQFRQACALNAPTDIVLTFADYLDNTNKDARRFEQLSERTIKFVEELERVAHAPVSLVNTRFPRDPTERIDLRTVIDRRNWVTRRRRTDVG